MYAVKKIMVSLLLCSSVSVALFAQQAASTPAPTQQPAAHVDALQLYRSGNYEAAIKQTLHEIQADRNNMDSYAVLCWSYNTLKRYNEAIQYATQAYQISKSDHRIVGILAEANFGLKHDQAALDYYQKFITLGQNMGGWDPRYLRDAYRDMGDIYTRIGEFHHADISFVAAIAYDRGPSAYEPQRAARLWVRLGFAREQLKDKAAAEAAYQTALAKDAQSDDAKAGLDRVKAL